MAKGQSDERLVSLLLKNEGSYLSGEALASSMGVTRAALWKRVNALRERGFVIEAERGRGYRLLEPPDLSAEVLRTYARGKLGREVIFYESLDSTNDTAMGLASGGAAHGTVVLADEQRKGRGRLGRRWASPQGRNIYMSIILRPGMRPREAALITLMAAVSAATAIREKTGLGAGIKWPNDLIAGGRKLGGILTEVRSDPDRVLHAVVGVGINVNMAQSDFPHSIRGSATSVFMETGKRHRRTPIVAALLGCLEGELERFTKEGRGPLLEEWRRLSSTLGKTVRVDAGDEEITGVALDIDDEGRLVLKAGDGLRRISSGDLTMLREQGAS